MTPQKKQLEHYRAMTEKPGKFEMEKPLTPYLYNEAYCLGDGEEIACNEEHGHNAYLFDLMTEEWEIFSQGEDSFPWQWVLVEDSQGYTYTMTPEKYEQWKA